MRTGMRMCEQWWFTVLVSGGSRHCWVSMSTMWLSHSKWLSGAMNLHQILLEAWTFLCGNYFMIQKAVAMGNWWLATSSQQHTHSCIISHAVFLVKHQITQVTQPLLQPRFGILWLLAFPRTKITFEREEISDHQWDSGKILQGSWWWLELCELPRYLLWRGQRHHCHMYNVSCIFYLLQYMLLFFILYGWIHSGQMSYEFLLSTNEMVIIYSACHITFVDTIAVCIISVLVLIKWLTHCLSRLYF